MGLARLSKGNLGYGVFTLSPVFSSSLPLFVDGVSSPCLETKTKSSLLRVDTESEETLIFPTEALSSMTQEWGSTHEWLNILKMPEKQKP